MYSNLTVKRPLILGGSRGLGYSLAGQVPDSIVCSRKSEISIDLSQEGSSKKVLQLVEMHQPDAIFYMAGGGPHGDFFSKPFQSHQWAYNLNFATPIAIAYGLIAKRYQGAFVYIGSAIAERSDSSESISYAQSKRMAKDCLLTIDEEVLKVRVFSSPYMDTDLLPPRAWPRLEAPELVISTAEVTSQMLRWLKKPDSSNGNSDVRHFDWLERFAYNIPEGRRL